MLQRKSKIAVVVFALLVMALVVGYAVPPYYFQSAAYFSANRAEFERVDAAFAESSLEEWSAPSLSVAPIFKTESGARLYHVGTVYRFKHRYDVSFMSGGQYATCSLFGFYSESTFCDLPLPGKWRVHFERLG